MPSIKTHNLYNTMCHRITNINGQYAQYEMKSNIKGLNENYSKLTLRAENVL